MVSRIAAEDDRVTSVSMLSCAFGRSADNESDSDRTDDGTGCDVGEREV